VNLGVSLNCLERFEEALNACELAIAIDANDADAWNVKGNIFMGMKNYDGALGAYNRALAIDPEHAHAWYSKGVALSRQRPCDTC
jgi:tetratricopeptide (TPR) repeat protein